MFDPALAFAPQSRDLNRPEIRAAEVQFQLNDSGFFTSSSELAVCSTLMPHDAADMVYIVTEILRFGRFAPQPLHDMGLC